MTLYVPRWALFVVLALSLIPEGACGSTRPVEDHILRRSLYDVIPVCATCCVKQFVQTEYAPGTCSDGDDTQCLCRTNTTSGFTLGEGALRCVISSCPKEVLLSSDVYNICNSVPGALPRTHPVITATVMSVISYPATASPSSASFTSATTCTFTTQSASLGTPSPWSVSMSSSQTTSSNKTSARPWKQTSTSAAASSTGSVSRLDKPALIGVSVATGIAAAGIAGVALFFCCRKLGRKRREVRERNTFEIGGEMSEPPNFRLAPARVPAAPDGGGPAGAVFNDRGIRGVTTPFGPSHYRDPGLLVTRHDAVGSAAARASEIGVAVSPEFDVVDSPRSQTSQRTLSQLLPDKPTYDLHPRPLQCSRNAHSRPASGETLFEEDVERPRSVLGPSKGYTTMHGLEPDRSNNTTPNKPPFVGLPAHPRANMYRVDGGWATPRGDSHVQGPNPLNQYWQGSYLYEGTSTGQPLAGGHALQQPHGPMTRQLAPRAPTTVDFHRFSGNPQLLTPVKEANTPSPNDTPNEYFDVSPAAKYSPMSRSATASPSAEIVARPRIVKGEEVKRIRVQGTQPCHRLGTEVGESPSSSDVSQMPWKRPVKRVSPSERKLTPSRRGGDLILSVDSL